MRLLSRSIDRLIWVGVICISLTGTLLTQTVEAQTVLYVKADAAGASDGTSWADAHTSLQDALARAKAGDAIWVAAGQYTPGGPNERNATFQLKTGIELYGGFTGAEVARIPLVRADGRPVRPKGSAVTSDGRYALISAGPSSQPFSQALGHVYVLDLRSRRVVGTVTGVGHDPYALAVVER